MSVPQSKEMKIPMLYECPRCHFASPSLTIFTKHCNRKRPCKGEDITIDLSYFAKQLKEQHLSSKQYQCDKCDKKFKTKSTLKQHSKKQHPTNFGEENVICLLDDGTFMTHLIHKHGNVQHIFKVVTSFVFKNVSIRYLKDDDTFAIVRNDIWTIITDYPDRLSIIFKAIQKVNMIMQHPFSLEDVEPFKNNIGDKMYNDLERWTYDIDLCTMDTVNNLEAFGLFMESLV